MESTARDPQLPDAATERRFPTSRSLAWIEAVLLVYFGLRLLFLAASISPYVPPDEVTHFGICRIFSRVLFLPDNSPASYQYGLVTNVPWLYYWIMGKLLHLNFFGISDLLFLRLLNIPLAFGTIYYALRMLRLFSEDRPARILLLAAMTNTMMFSFLSASVSYDNLTNLLAAMAVYYLLAFFRKGRGNLLALSVLCQLAGCLAKLTLLPLVPILGILLVIHEARSLRTVPPALTGWFRNSGWRGMTLAAGIAVGLVLNVRLYGGNYYRFGTLAPGSLQVLPLEQALKYRLAARAYIFDRLKEGGISLDQAHRMTSIIKHPGDRESADYMIDNYAEAKAGRLKTMGLAEYFPLWVGRMAAGIFGIFGHLAIANEWPTIAPIAFLELLSLIAIVVRWRPREEGAIPAYLATIAGAYGFFLMYEVNYLDYLDSKAFYTSLQGRYIFPVIGPLYVLTSYYLLRLFRRTGGRMAVLWMAVFIYVLCDFPFFWANVSPEWYGRP